MGDARISILEVLKNQILRKTFDCQATNFKQGTVDVFDIDFHKKIRGTVEL